MPLIQLVLCIGSGEFAEEIANQLMNKKQILLYSNKMMDALAFPVELYCVLANFTLDLFRQRHHPKSICRNPVKEKTLVIGC